MFLVFVPVVGVLVVFSGSPIFLFVLPVILFRLDKSLPAIALGSFGLAPLDDLIKLAAIQPNAAAFKAIIYLDPLALCHKQVNVANWTLHDYVYAILLIIFRGTADRQRGRSILLNTLGKKFYCNIRPFPLVYNNFLGWAKIPKKETRANDPIQTKSH